MSPPGRTMDYSRAVAWYALFGVMHELFHFIVATAISQDMALLKQALENWKPILFDMVLHRQVSIPSQLCAPAGSECLSLTLIRASGWIFSLCLAVFVHTKAHTRNATLATQISSGDAWFVVAAYLTALDAIATDLFGIPKISILAGINPQDYSFSEEMNSLVILHCGNFGVILLHGAWFENGGRYAFDILEKMIQVTMMRGAQSGGIVTFHGKETNESADDGRPAHNMIGSRIRVVKSKREDLSKLLRKKISKISVNSSGKGFAAIINKTRFFAGHTRFATTSKATFDGTHPHQWSKPKYYMVYNMEELADNDSVGFRLNNAVADLSSKFLRHSRYSAGRRHIARPNKTRVEHFVTHNGDFEFYDLNGKTYELDAIQKWLEVATGCEKPSTVDSAAIAGMIDLIRTMGSFALSVRYVVCLGFPTSKIHEDVLDVDLPSSRQYEKIAKVFEDALHEFLTESPYPMDMISRDPEKREDLARKVASKLTTDECKYGALVPLNPFLGHEEQGSGIYNFAVATIRAFFDNDLLTSVKMLMTNAKGSFGLCVMSSLDSHRQMCFAARGQTMSVAFYPKKHVILYGSEQAAVKAAMHVDFPGISVTRPIDRSTLNLNVDSDVLRLDLDDVGGEICLVDWGKKQYKACAVSPPNQHIVPQSAMNGQVCLYLIQESVNLHEPDLLYHRMTKLSKNVLITDLKDDSDDLILEDIRDIPKVCSAIQDDWMDIGDKSSMFSLNRLTAWNLGRSIKERLEQYASGKLTPCANRVDILLTGCEVSLWLAEQFASDLQKSFPKLRIVAISSNKLLGLYGQEGISIPTIGHPISENSLNLFDSITIIVSHSGGTFSPLGCSSLFQSKTNNIFVVTSEWDTQIGKQLRSFDNQDGITMRLVFNSRIFVTGVGMRPAEPCSVSVAATHQLLTNIYEFISIVILSDERYRHVTGAVVTFKDLQTLERCNRENIAALEDIVGADTAGLPFAAGEDSTEIHLRKAGDMWSNHILENVKAYVMTIMYIIGTVVSGYPLASGIAAAAGFSGESRISYFLRFIDALIYILLPQINVIILRVFEKRRLLHRMVGRTVVIGDIPWVAQSAEAFLSKIFACSYSIAGLNVLSANPADHLVHRMTHRVVRGSLLICGRPDGRLSALTAAESAVSLSINQASSIQSLGSTCESVTIGHNPFKLPLTANAIFLRRFRPLFLCEHLIGDSDNVNSGLDVSVSVSRRRALNFVAMEEVLAGAVRENEDTLLNETITNFSGRKVTSTKQSKGRDRKPLKTKQQSSAVLLSIYKSLESNTIEKLERDHSIECSCEFPITEMIETAIAQKKWSDSARQIFEFLDVDKDAMLNVEEFVGGLMNLNTGRHREDLEILFHHFETPGGLSFDNFFKLMSMNKIEVEESLEPSIRDDRGLIQVKANNEGFFGEGLIQRGGRSVPSGAMKSQDFAQELYESRVASLQRFVAMTVMFHQMGWRVSNFFCKWSFGLLGYRMDRTHSVMRIATTASPISGADIRDRKRAIFYMRKIRHSVQIISSAWLTYKAKKLRIPPTQVASIDSQFIN